MAIILSGNCQKCSFRLPLNVKSSGHPLLRTVTQSDLFAGGNASLITAHICPTSTEINEKGKSLKYQIKAVYKLKQRAVNFGLPRK